MRWIIPVVLAAAALAVDPVQLHQYPQKFRTFYSLTGPAVPSELRRPPEVLPVGEITARATGSRTAWIGTRQGLIRVDDSVPEADRVQYFAGRRYLPDDEVQAILPIFNGVWVRTRTGVSKIEMMPMTLRQKADYFEKRIVERHDRYGLVADSAFTEPGNPATNRTHDNDNDGLWTAMYAAAKCFEFAVTGSQEALARAKRATEAVLFLEQVTGRPGFPARSYIKKGETRGQGGEWHWTPDGQIEWKGDTSSDEIVGHFFIFAIAHDLLPDPDLKKRIVATATRIMDHIIQNGYHLIDVDGKPTLWGKWSPEYFATPNGKGDSPLNALELLAFLRATHHFTGNQKYEDEYQKVALKMKYLERTARLLELRDEINYSDEELAMLPFYLIFQYEKDPAFLEVYRKALDQWWHNIWREKNPLWTFIYLTGNPRRPVDLPAAVWTLYRIPMDLIHWGVKNSHRKDVVMESAQDRFKRPQSANLLPPDERPVMKWNGNPFRIDGGGNGGGEDDGAFFLLPYWMGRYHGFVIGE